MPHVARQALLHRLVRTGRLDQALLDFTLVSGIEARFRPHETPKTVDPPALSVPLTVAGHRVGHLEVVDAGLHPRRQAVERILTWAARGLARDLLDIEQGSGNALPAAIRVATAYLKNHYRESVMLADVAEAAGLSRERLSRLFHRSLGISFSAYLNELRLNHARRQLIETDEPVAAIAFSSGFQSLSQFNRRFRQAEGVSPRAYRRDQALPLSA